MIVLDSDIIVLNSPVECAVITNGQTESQLIIHVDSFPFKVEGLFNSNLGVVERVAGDFESQIILEARVLFEGWIDQRGNAGPRVQVR